MRDEDAHALAPSFSLSHPSVIVENDEAMLRVVRFHLGHFSFEIASVLEHCIFRMPGPSLPLVPARLMTKLGTRYWWYWCYHTCPRAWKGIEAMSGSRQNIKKHADQLKLASPA